MRCLDSVTLSCQVSTTPLRARDGDNLTM
jgi:hypothetical protein